MRRYWIIFVGLILMLAMAGAAQAQRRRTPAKRNSTRPPTQSVPIKSNDKVAPPAQTPPPAPSEASPTLAIVNDVTVTAADIDSAVSSSILNDPDLYLQAFYQDREKEIREGRGGEGGRWG